MIYSEKSRFCLCLLCGGSLGLNLLCRSFLYRSLGLGGVFSHYLDRHLGNHLLVEVDGCHIVAYSLDVAHHDDFAVDIVAELLQLLSYVGWPVALTLAVMVRATPFRASAFFSASALIAASL